MSQTASFAPSKPYVHPRGERFDITPLEAPLGARVTGIDLNHVKPEQVLQLKHALHEHHILVFNQQHLSDPDYLRFATHFGTVFQPPADIPVLSSGKDGRAPEIVKVANTEDGELGNGAIPAHADHQWTPSPSSGSFLYAQAVPSSGGETRFTNLVLAYETLDAATREEIDGLRLITYNPFVRRQLGGYNGGSVRYRTPNIPAIQGTEHPLVRTHPDSGKRLLFLGVATEVEVAGVDPAYGQALIERLRAHLEQPRFHYSHQWQPGDIVWWDNQAVLHARNAFPANEQRRMKRISLAGSRPF